MNTEVSSEAYGDAQTPDTRIHYRMPYIRMHRGADGQLYPVKVKGVMVKPATRHISRKEEREAERIRELLSSEQRREEFEESLQAEIAENLVPEEEYDFMSDR